MTPPSSPRAGRSTVSAAGEPTDEFDALDRALLACYGSPQGTNAQAILHLLAQDGYTIAASPAGPEAVPQSEREGLLRAALEEIAEGTEPDRIGKYEYLRDWVHRTARGALASPAHPDEEPR